MVKSVIKSISRSWMNRTWKREVAALLLAVHTVMTVVLLVGALDRMGAATGIYGVWTALVYTFVLGAFGLDALSKQLAPGPKPPV